MRIILATHNDNKLNEFRAMINQAQIKLEVVSLKELDFIQEIVEDGHTFHQNALIKAQTIAKLYPNDCVIADDSGLCCHGLDLAPGIYSARYAGGGDNNELLLKNLNDVSDRRAYFITCICLVIPGLEPIFTSGKVDGYILNQAQGENGFGYDPIFSTDNKTSFAELTAEQKNAISHRFLALDKVVKLNVWEQYV